MFRKERSNQKHDQKDLQEKKTQTCPNSPPQCSQKDKTINQESLEVNYIKKTLEDVKSAKLFGLNHHISKKNG